MQKEEKLMKEQKKRSEKYIFKHFIPVMMSINSNNKRFNRSLRDPTK